MQRFSSSSWLAVLGLAAGLAAQRTWVVDSNKGPGYDFQIIQQGVDAARSGDIVLVRSGSYTPFTVSKGIRIFGAPGTDIVSTYGGSIPIHVRDLPAGETLVLAGLRTTVFPFFTSIVQIYLQRCAGPVVLENVYCSGPGSNINTLGQHGVRIMDSKAVTLNGCLVGFGLFAERSAVMASDSVFRRYDGISITAPLAAIELRNSRATFARCTSVGETARSPLLATPALEALLSRVSIRGRSTMLAGAITGARSPALAGDAASSLELDPRVTVRGSGGASAITGFGTVVSQPLPALSARGGELGSSIDIEVLGTRGHVFALSASAPAPPLTIPPFGALWLDPRFRVHLWAGIHDSSGATELRLPLPADANLRGIPLAWQTIGGPWPAIVYSNAVVTTLR